MATLRVPLPAEMEPYKDDMEYFVSSMVRKLHVNRHKGTSKQLSVPALIKQMKVEIDELERAIDKEGQFDAPLEAADVANFAFLTAIAIWHMTREQFEAMRRDVNLAKTPYVRTPYHKGGQVPVYDATKEDKT